MERFNVGNRHVIAVAVDTRHAARLVRKERPDGSPLKVREFVSHDSRPPVRELESRLTRCSQRGIAGLRWAGLRTCCRYVKNGENDPRRKFDTSAFRM